MSDDVIYTEKEARLWSRLGPRATFGAAALRRAKEDDGLLVLSADTRSSAGLEPFRREFPDRYIDFGIAEQNMIAAAAGLASEGFRVVTATFAPFQTMRCCEQIRVNLGQMGYPVVLVGLGAGLVLGEQGFTHCCVEDVGVLRSIPNLTILEPADCGAVAALLETALRHTGPVYLRLTGGPRSAIVYPTPVEMSVGGSNELRDGSDAAIFAAGASVGEALKAAELLETRGVSAAVIDLYSVKPLNTEVIERYAGRVKRLAVVEEHNRDGALVDSLGGYLARRGGAPRLLAFGVNDRYIRPGDYRYLLEQYALTAEQIADAIALSLEQGE